MITMSNICSLHGLTKSVETVLYIFLARDRSRNHVACMKDSSLRQHLATSSCHCYAIADGSNLSPKVIGSCIKVHLLVQVEITKET